MKIGTEEQLRELCGYVRGRSKSKQLSRLDLHSARLEGNFSEFIVSIFHGLRRFFPRLD